MTKMYVPAVGDRVNLEADWSFDLVLERRNWKFAESQKLIEPVTDRWGRRNKGPEKVRASLPVGTTLEIDRVYIRTFNKSRVSVDEDYDSITFKVMKNGKAVRNQRFWVKLTDCNNIEFSQDPDGKYRDRVKLVKEVLQS